MFSTRYRIQNTRPPCSRLPCFTRRSGQVAKRSGQAEYRPHGVAALITVLSLGGLIFTISMGSALISFWANQNIKSIRDSNKAYYAAYSGLQDSLIKLERNKDFGVPSNSFPLSVYNTSDVSVSITNSSGQAIVNATSTIGQVNKKLQAVIDIDTTTGLIAPTSTTELTL